MTPFPLKVAFVFVHVLAVVIVGGGFPAEGSWSPEQIFLDWFKNSNLAARLHAKHIAAPRVQHMMKETPLATAPDEAKMKFATSVWGHLVSNVMATEQELLGDWKIEKIVEAAGGDFDRGASHEVLVEMINRVPVNIFSFVDCPWCLLAKNLLREEPYGYVDNDGTLQIIELEDLGWEGKKLRASIALATGRTSMPACFIFGRSVGGFTDGFENVADFAISQEDRLYDLRLHGASGLQKMHETGELRKLLSRQSNTKLPGSTGHKG